MSEGIDNTNSDISKSFESFIVDDEEDNQDVRLDGPDGHTVHDEAFLRLEGEHAPDKRYRYAADYTLAARCQGACSVPGHYRDRQPRCKILRRSV